MLFTIYAAFIGSLIAVFLKSYFSQKGKNVATKEDVKVITEKIEKVKNTYQRSMEIHKMELKKIYDISRPSLSKMTELDNILIDNIASLNEIGFDFSRLNKNELGESFSDKLHELVIFLIKYRVRYAELEGVKNLIENYNKMNKSIENRDKDMIKKTFNDISNDLEIILSYFIEPIGLK